MKNLHFQDGGILPAIGLGTWQAEPDEVYETVLEALRAGYRHIDCAHIYKNEIEVGQALDYAFRYGIVRRSELFITSKLWNSDHDPSRVEYAINKSISKLQIKDLDLYLMHWPIATKIDKEMPSTPSDLISLDDMPLEETWKLMSTLKTKGLSKHIGVSNFNIPKIEKLIAKTKIKPELNQIEIHPYFQQKELVEYCQKKGIIVTAYSPLGGSRIKEKKINLFENPIIVEIAAKHNASPVQIILAWGIQRGIAVIPKTVNAKRLIENLASENIKLSAEEMKKMESLDKNMRGTTGSFWTKEGSPYTQKSLWEE